MLAINDMYVSIIMPSLNQARYIEQAINSIADQKTEDLELIIMDGGSTDGTALIVDQASRLTSLVVKWICGPDTGPANAINKALSSSSGAIIGWLNSDDLYERSAIQNAITALELNPNWLMVYGHGQHVDEFGTPTAPYPTSPPEVGIQGFKKGCFICQPTVFFRRSMVQELGLLDETLTAAFDLDWWMRAFAQFPERIGFIDKLQASTRLHNDSITFKKKRIASLEAMRLMHSYFDSTPQHWLRSCAYQIIADHHSKNDLENTKPEIEKLIKDVAPYFPIDTRLALKKEILIELYCLQERLSSSKKKNIKDKVLRIFQRIRDRTHLSILRASKIFDSDWYRKQYPDVAAAGIDPANHYFYYGAVEGRDPSPLFSTRFYFEAHPDVLISGLNPLVHYELYGRNEGRVKLESTLPFDSRLHPLFLHVGTDKTGSTAIQNFLNLNSDRLPLLSLLYPLSHRQNAVHHHRLHKAAIKNDLKPWRDLANELELRKELTGIVSFEGFYNLSSAQLRRIRSTLRKFDVKVIIYLRRQSDKVSSGIAQTFKSGNNFFIDDYNWRTLRSMAQDYEVIVDKLAGVFGEDNLLVRPYEKSQWTQLDLIVDFLEAINGPGSIQKDDERFLWPIGNPNPSLDVECLRLLNELDSLFIPQSTRDLVKNALLILTEDDKSTFVSDLAARRIDRRFRRSNRRLASRFTNRKELFLQPPTFRYRPVNKDKLEKYNRIIWNIISSASLIPWNGQVSEIDLLLKRNQIKIVFSHNNSLTATSKENFFLIKPTQNRVNNLFFHGGSRAIKNIAVTVQGTEAELDITGNMVQVNCRNINKQILDGVIICKLQIKSDHVWHVNRMSLN